MWLTIAACQGFFKDFGIDFKRKVGAPGQCLCQLVAIAFARDFLDPELFEVIIDELRIKQAVAPLTHQRDQMDEGDF